MLKTVIIRKRSQSPSRQRQTGHKRTASPSITRKVPMAQRRRGQPERCFQSVPDLYVQLRELYNSANEEYENEHNEAEEDISTVDEKTMKERKVSIEQTMILNINENVDVYVTEDGQDRKECAATTATRLVRPFLIYNNHLCMAAFRYYPGGITHNVRIWTFERPVRGRGDNRRRNPFDHTQLEKYLSCSVTTMHVWASLRDRLKERNVRRGTWAFYLSPDARGFVTSVVLHVINHVAYLASQLYAGDADAETDETGIALYEALDAMDVGYGSGNDIQQEQMAYNTPPEMENGIHEVWCQFVKKYEECMETVVNQVIEGMDVTRYELVKVGRGNRKLPPPDQLITPHEVFHAIFYHDDTSARFGSLFLESLYSVDIATKTVNAEQIFSGGLTGEHRETLGDAYGRLMNSVTYCMQDEAQVLNRYIRRNRSEIVRVALVDFEARRAAIYAADYRRPVPTQIEARRLTKAQILAMLPQHPEHQRHLPTPSVSLSMMRPSAAVSRPQNQTGGAGPSTAIVEESAAHACMLCEQEWPQSKDWPPAPTRVVNGHRITVERIEEEDDVARRTRSHNPELVEVSTVGTPRTPAAPQIVDHLDTISNTLGATNETRTAALRTLLNEIIARTRDVPGTMGILRAVLTEEENRIAAVQAQQEEKRQLQQQQEAERVERARLAQVAREEKQRIANQRKEAVQGRKEEDTNRITAAIESRTRGGPAASVVEEAVASAQVLNLAPPQEVVEQPPPPDPTNPRPPPPPPNAVVLRRRPTIHRWIPIRWYRERLGERPLYDVLASWGTPSDSALFNHGKVWSDDRFRQGFDTQINETQNFVDDMPTVYRNATDYVRLWTSILYNRLFTVFRELATTPTTWASVPPPNDLCVRSNQYPHHIHLGPAGLQLDNRGFHPTNPAFTARLWFPADQHPGRHRRHRVGDVVIVRCYIAQHGTGKDTAIIYTQTSSHLCFVAGYAHEGQYGGPNERRSIAYTIVKMGIADNRGRLRSQAGLRSSGLTYLHLETVDYIHTLQRADEELRQLQDTESNRITALLLNHPIPVDNPLERIDDNWMRYTTRNLITARPNERTANLRDWLNNYIRNATSDTFQDRIQDYTDRVHMYDGHTPEPIGGGPGATVCNTTQLMAAVLMMSRPRGRIDAAQIFRDYVTAVIGPPGTGKTHTLIHTLALIVHSDMAMRDELILMNNLLQLYEDADDEQVEGIIRRMRARNNETVLPKILIVTPTHKALDVVESKLLDRAMPVYDLEHRRWERVIPFYRRVAHPMDDARNPELDNMREEIIPEVITSNYCAFITLSTLGSVHRAFWSTNSANMQRYDYVFVDEASMASDLDIIPLLGYIRDATGPRNHLPRISFLGDPLQLPPNTQGQPSLSRLIERCSFFERLVTGCVPGIPGSNTVRTIQLDIQYRMHPAICDLVNIISSRNLITVPSVNTPWMMEDVADPVRIYNGNISQLLTDINFANPLIWIDPYVALDHNTSSDTYRQLSADFQTTRETSVLETMYALALLRHLVYTESVQGFEDILVLTAYNNQKIQLQDAATDRLRDILPEENTFTESRIRTVESSEGFEANTVIYVSGRGPDNTGANEAVGDTSLVNDLRNLHVLASRAKRRFYVVASAQFYRDNCPRWGPTLDFFQENP